VRAIVAAAVVVPAAFTALAAWAAVTGGPGLLAAVLLAALEWALWAAAAVWAVPRSRAGQARWSRKDAAELQAILGTAPKRGRR
jgi:hypothetical protein